MDVPLLIDAIVRQTTVLVAQLATASGTRASLAHTANQVFLSLVQELKQQGLGSKVIADMFGLALRTYHNRIQRLSESATFRGRSIWEAVFEYVQEQGPLLRADVLGRFGRDDEGQVRAVLSDLVDSQLLLRTGRGDATTYRAATDADRVKDTSAEPERLASLAWVAIHRFGPLELSGLLDVLPAPRVELAAALERLTADGRVVRRESAGKTEYEAQRYLIPVGDPFGWEAAIFDHYQAMVTAICNKVQSESRKASQRDLIGGSTYCYDVAKAHPLHDEVAGFLSRVRRQAVELRERVEAYNREHGEPSEDERVRFTAYVGQTFVSAAENDTGEET